MITLALPDLQLLLAAFEAGPADVGCLRALADCLEDECDEPELAEACLWLLRAVPWWAGAPGYYWIKAVGDRSWDISMRNKPPPVIALKMTSIDWNLFFRQANAMTAIRRCLIQAIRERVA